MAEKKKPKASVNSSRDKHPSVLQAFLIHLICGVFCTVGFWVAHNVYAVDLVSDPALTLRLIWVIEFPVVVIIYSLFRKSSETCWFWRAAARSIPGLLIGALINALGAIALGAPIGLQFLPKTINWSLLMSVFTFVPAAIVFGASWTDWHRIFACTKPSGCTDYMICLPAYGAVIGAWFGAWPMPLDWERPWQDWPICVSYGAMAGYFVGMMGSLVLVLARGKHDNVKLE